MYGNVYQPVQTLEKAPKINTGGLCWLIFFLWEDVEIWPVLDPLTGTITSPLVLKAFKQLYYCRAVEKDRFYKENDKRDGTSVYVEMIISAILAGNTRSNSLSLKRMRFHQYGILLKDRNGEIRQLGDADSGARFISNYDSGTLSISRNRDIQWQWNYPAPAPFYEVDHVLIGSDPVLISAVVQNGEAAFTTEDDIDLLTEDNEKLIYV